MFSFSLKAHDKEASMVRSDGAKLNVKNLTGGGRIEYIDLAKGICIILVVARHALGFLQTSNPLDGYFSSFEMPLFFFLSGLFFKRYDSYLVFVKRKVNSLLIPFIFFFLFASILPYNILALIGYETQSPFYSGFITPLCAFLVSDSLYNGPIWFLMCLFWVNLIFYVVVSFSERLFKREGLQFASLLILVLTCGTIGYSSYVFEVNLPLFIDTAFSALPWFGMGYLLHKFTPILTYVRCDKYLPIGIVLLFAISYLLTGGLIAYRNIFVGDNVFLIYLRGACGSLMVMFIAKALRRLPFVSFWGRYTIVILCTHFLLLKVLVKIAEVIQLKTILGEWPTCIIVIAITMFSYQLIIPLCIRFIPWFTAQKDLIKV